MLLDSFVSLSLPQMVTDHQFYGEMFLLILCRVVAYGGISSVTISVFLARCAADNSGVASAKIIIEYFN